MFRKLQWKLTLLHTLILVSILAILNVSAYFILESYNVSQMANETVRMLEEIEDSDWLEENEDEQIPDTIELSPSSEGQESTEEPEDATEPEESEHPTGSTDKDDDGDDGDDDDMDGVDEDTDDPDEDVWLPLMRHVAMLSTATTSPSIATEIKANAPPDAVPARFETLHVPSLLKRFSFYLVFDRNGNLVAHNIGNRQTLDAMMALAPAIPVDKSPTVHVLSSSPAERLLLLKRPLVIEGISQGTYLVGQDLGLVTDTMSNLRRILLLSFASGILVSLLAGYLLAGRVIRPIRDAYERKQRFLADASHELRTPISVVLLSTESMERDLMPGQEDARADLADIREETFRMRDLVERLLFLARHDSLLKPSATERVNLSALLNNVLSALRVLAQARDISMELRCPDGLVCPGDEKMLTSLFTILVENAIKYNNEHGRVILEASQVIKKRKPWIEIHIKDTGVGIPESEQMNIFQRFYRADPSRNQKTGGHGLGLAIAKEIAEAHAGAIEVISQTDVGTTFTVRLPGCVPKSS